MRLAFSLDSRVRIGDYTSMAHRTETHPRPTAHASGTVHACLALLPALTALIIYAPATSFGVVTLDDPAYVMNNPHVLGGLTWEGVAWAFSPGHDTYWHPLVWLSLMLDGSISASPGWFHLVNIAMHAASATLLYLALHKMSGSRAPALAVALLFAAHPLNVEAVAWITERKTVLAGLFWVLCMYLYALYAARSGALRYLAVLTALALGLLAKPLLVTLPCALLLLDYWPLRRLSISPGVSLGLSPARAVAEKLPMFALVAASVAMTMISHPMESAGQIVPLVFRAANAVVSYMGYLSKAVWPGGLAVYYPFPESLPAWQVAGSLTAITAMTAACLLLCRKAPYAVVGWLWFLGVMTPMLGLVRHDRWPALADRFAYVPMIGLWIMLAFGLYAVLTRTAARKAAAVALAVAIIALGAASRHQLQFWSGSEALYRRALSETRDNWMAHNNLGSVLYARGDTQEAVVHFKRALEIRPGYGSAQVNLGVWRMRLGDLAAAEEYFQKATETEAAGSAWQGLADIRSSQGQYEQALGLYQRALHHNPRLLSSWRGKAESLKLSGQQAEAANAYVEAAQRHLDTYRLETAVELAEEALALMPGMADAKAVRQRAQNKLQALQG